MSEPFADDRSSSGIRTTRLLTILLITLLVINFGLVALALHAPSPPAPTSILLSGPISHSPQVPVPSQVAEAEVAGALETPAAPWDEFDIQAHIVPDSADLEPLVAVPASQADVTAKSPIMPPEQANDSLPAATSSPPIATPSLPPEPATVVVRPTGLFLMNPPSSGGPVHYVVADEVFSLLPGEYHRLDADVQRRIRFHRGDDFGDADHQLQQGTYQFIVGDSGWELQPADEPLADRLLTICRPLP